jgi:hypothetical protein
MSRVTSLLNQGEPAPFFDYQFAKAAGATAEHSLQSEDIRILAFYVIRLGAVAARADQLQSFTVGL